MNRQVDYIVYATLLLISIGLILQFAQKLPSEQEKLSISYNNVPETTARPPLTASVAKGKILFRSHCASCHVLHKSMTGPRLYGFTERGPWTVRQNVYDWIRNPMEFAQRNEYARKLIEVYRTQMLATPGLSNEDIDAIINYINY